MTLIRNDGRTPTFLAGRRYGEKTTTVYAEFILDVMRRVLDARHRPSAPVPACVYVRRKEAP